MDETGTEMKRIQIRIGNRSKIVSILPAQDNSFLLEEVDYSNFMDPYFSGKYQKNLLHIDQKGQVCWKHPNYSQHHHIRMISSQEAVIFKQMGKHINILNLSTHRLVTCISPDWSVKAGFNIIALDVFQSSSLISICSMQEKKRVLRINYYRSHELRQLNQPLVHWESESNEVALYSDIRQVNAESKIGWWKVNARHSNQFIFYFCQLNNYPQLKECLIRTINICMPEGMGSIRMQVLWQIRPWEYLIAAKFEIRGKEKPNRSETVLQNFMIQDSESESAVIRLIKFEFEGRQIVLEYNRISRVTGFKTLMFETLRLHPKGCETKLYYLNADTEQIELVEDCHVRQQLHGNEQQASVQNQFTGFTVKEKEGIITWGRTEVCILPPELIYLHFLININPDFDDDLLTDAVSLLSPLNI